MLALLVLAAQIQLSGPPPAPAADPSLRSTEIFRLDCASQLGRREVTLFGNGTVRLREGPPGGEGIGLAELGPAEVEALTNRIAEEDLSEIHRLSSGVSGDWIERCELHLRLAGRPPRDFRFGRYDTLPLSLSRVLRVVEDAAAEIREPVGRESLPAGYRPRPGDVLKRTDGQLFEIHDFTADKRGLELWGVNEPLVLYVVLDELRREFVALVRSRSGIRP